MIIECLHEILSFINAHHCPLTYYNSPRLNCSIILDDAKMMTRYRIFAFPSASTIDIKRRAAMMVRHNL